MLFFRQSRGVSEDEIKAEQEASPPSDSPSPPGSGEGVISHAQPTGPWGFWATLGLGAAIAVLYVLSQTMMLILFAAGLAIAGKGEVLSDPKALDSNGLFLGYARLRTGSIYTTIILHAVMNLGATIQVAAFLRFIDGAG